jgi:hypothetical protein
MPDNSELLCNKLQQLLPQKRSNAFYAQKLGVPIEVVQKLRKQSSEEDVTSEEKEVNVEKGTLKSTIELTFDAQDIDQLYKLHKVDKHLYRITNYWSKLKSNGKFTSSVLASLIKSEEKDKETFIKNIEDIFSKTEKWKGPKDIEKKSKKALFVYISDDHAGIDFKNSLFNNPYSGDTYFERLSKLADKINSIEEELEELFIINLGDELDGFNRQTTRGGHSLDSLSNKEQFTIYTKARKMFYDKLFLRGYFNKITIININNSNHSGNDYSFITNKALQFYLEGKYSDIEFINQDRFIDHYYWGDHTFILTHGKDEKYMKSPMPLNLDNKTDLYLMDYSKSIGGTWFSTIKGDMHSYSVNIGKSGRYVNVPSICGGSNWIEHNFGSSSPGALMEIVDKHDKNIISIPIWF